jgi:hypothetical protein
MLKGKWKMILEPEPSRDYLGFITSLPLLRYSAIPRFIGFARKIERELVDAAGLIGYTLGAAPWKKVFLTLSVWEDECRLDCFVHSGFHREVMVSLRGDIGLTQFGRWVIRGNQVPPSWDTAIERLEGLAK